MVEGVIIDSQFQVDIFFIRCEGLMVVLPDIVVNLRLLEACQIVINN
jgi:hypothetical protein